MARYPKGEAIKVNYIALKKTLGLVDVSMAVYDELGALFATVVMTELPAPTGEDSGGLYQGSFTPDAEGQWRIRITSIANGDDISRVFEIDNYDIDDVVAKVDVIDGNVDAIKTKTDNLPANTATELTYIKNKVDSIDAQINPGGYIL